MNESGSNEPRMWEKSWGPEEIRKHSANWTLAGDAGLLNGLESLAQTLLTRTQEVQKEVDSLAQETRATSSRMCNAITDFLMLSNMQFVENRVYDEEIQEDANADKKNIIQKKTKEEREAELVPRISVALKFGLNVVETAFEKHEVIDSESEDEEEEEENPYRSLPVLKPKDFYSHRPLPFIIGSEKFMQDDYVGVGETLSDEEELDESDKEEMNEKKEISKKISDESSEESEIDSDAETVDKIKTSQDILSQSKMSDKKNFDTDEDADLFAPEHSDNELSSDDDSSNTSAPQVPAAAASFAAELAAKLGVSQQVPASSVTPKKESGKITDESRRNSKRKESEVKEKESSQNDVTDELSDEETDSPFGRKNTIFGGGGGLFDDLNDEESDLFSDIKPSKKQSIERTSSKSSLNERKDSKPVERKNSKSKSIAENETLSVSLFDDDESELFSSKMGDAPKPKETKSQMPASTKPVSLFDDPDDDDDLFASVPSRKSRSTTVENDDTDLFASVTSKTKEDPPPSAESTPKKKLPAGAVSLFGSATNPMTAALKAHRSQSESEKEETDSEISTPEKHAPAALSKLTSIQQSSEDILAGGDTLTTSTSLDIKKEAKNEETKKEAVKTKRTISLFDDDEDEEDNLFSNVTTKPKTEDIKDMKMPDASSNSSSKTGSLFDAEEDDLFQKKTEPDTKLRTHSLFDDDDILFGGPTEDEPSVDLFKTSAESTTAETPEVKSTPAAAVKSTTDSSVDLFNTLVESTNTESSKVKPTKPKSNVGLFDLTDEDEDLFSNLDVKTTKTPVPAPRRSSTVSDKPTSSTKTEKKIVDVVDVIPPTEESPKKKPIGGVSLFGGIDPFPKKLRSNSEIETRKPKEEKEDSVTSETPNEETKYESSLKLAMKPLPQVDEMAVSFDNAPQANTLKSTCKNRAAVQKRRPPTRKARQTAATRSNFFDAVDQVDSKESPLSSPEKSPSQDTANILSPSTEEEDVLPVDELVEAKVTPTISAQQNGAKEKDSNPTKKVGDEFFGGFSTKFDDDDIFASATKKKSSVVLADDEDEDDLFSSASKTTRSRSRTKDLDDLFGGPKVESKKKEKSTSLFDDDSEDDIFADSKSNKTLTTTKPSSKPSQMTSKEQTAKKSGGLFDDDDDDVSIFDDPLMVKREK